MRKSKMKICEGNMAFTASLYMLDSLAIVLPSILLTDSKLRYYPQKAYLKYATVLSCWLIQS